MGKEAPHIEAIKSRVGDLHRQLRDAEQELLDARIAYSGVKIGDVVIYRGAEYRVARIEPRSWGGKPWIVGNPKKRDGTFGTAQRNLCGDWSKGESDG